MIIACLFPAYPNGQHLDIPQLSLCHRATSHCIINFWKQVLKAPILIVDVSTSPFTHQFLLHAFWSYYMPTHLWFMLSFIISFYYDIYRPLYHMKCFFFSLMLGFVLKVTLSQYEDSHISGFFCLAYMWYIFPHLFMFKLSVSLVKVHLL